MAAASILRRLRDELEAPRAERPFGTGWISGTLALLLGLASLLLVVSLRHPALLTEPDLARLRDPALLLRALRVMLVVGDALALVSLVLRDSKVLGFVAMAESLACFSADRILGRFGPAGARVTSRLSAFLLLCIGTRITQGGATEVLRGAMHP